PWRRPLANLPAGALAGGATGGADRVRHGLRPGSRRVRVGDLHRRQHAHAHRNHSVADRHQAAGVRLQRCDRHRGGDAGRLLRHAARDPTSATLEYSTAAPTRMERAMTSSILPGVQAAWPARAASSEPALVRWLLIGATALFLSIFLLLPLAVVFGSALEKGLRAYLQTFQNPDARAAIGLTLLAAG